MNIGEVLSKAWKIIWKNKILWLFGILAGCSASGGGGGGSASGASGGGSGMMPPQGGNYGNGPSILAPSAQRALEQFERTVSSIEPWIWITIAISLVILGIGLAILSFFAGTLGTTGVIKGTGMADRADEDDKPISFGAIFKGIKGSYWKVILLQLGWSVLGFIVVMLLLIPLILFTVLTCGLGLFLLIPIGWFVSTMVNFTIIAIVEEGLGIFEAIARAWHLIIKGLGQVVVMFLILGIGKIVVGLVIGLPVILIPLPIIINLFSAGFQDMTVSLVISGILMLVIIPIIVFLSGVLQAYVLSAWTLTYHRLAETHPLDPEVLSKPAKTKK
ncbi:hypothetical protein KQH50_01745 [bacterium]|nr:hypothetical protein [bacterium]